MPSSVSIRTRTQSKLPATTAVRTSVIFTLPLLLNDDRAFQPVEHDSERGPSTPLGMTNNPVIPTEVEGPLSGSKNLSKCLRRRRHARRLRSGRGSRFHRGQGHLRPRVEEVEVILVELDPDRVVRVGPEIGVGAGDDELVAQPEVDVGEVAGRLDGIDLRDQAPRTGFAVE